MYNIQRNTSTDVTALVETGAMRFQSEIISAPCVRL